MIKRLILLFLLLPFLCSAGPIQQAHKAVIAGQLIASGGGESCSGAYGIQSADTTVNDDDEGSVYLSKITLDCDASAGDLYVYTQYTGNSSNEWIGVLYNSNGDLLWQSAPSFGSSPGWQSGSFTGLSLTAGDYYIGGQHEGTSGKYGRIAAPGYTVLHYAGLFGTPPASINIGDPLNSQADYRVDAYLDF